MPTSVRYQISPPTPTAGAVNVVLPIGVTITPAPVVNPVSPYVIYDPSPPAPAGAIKVSGNNTLDITIYSEMTNKGAVYYTPIGIAFQKQGALSSSGGSTFTSTVSGNTLTVTDNDSSSTSGTYEFVVLFQDATGNFLVLDPKISNM